MPYQQHIQLFTFATPYISQLFTISTHVFDTMTGRKKTVSRAKKAPKKTPSGRHIVKISVPPTPPPKVPTTSRKGLPSAKLVAQLESDDEAAAAAPKKKGRPFKEVIEIEETPPPAEFKCVVEIYIFIDGKRIGDRTRSVDLLSPYGVDHPGHYHIRDFALSRAKEYTFELLQPAKRWECIYGAKTDRKSVEVADNEDLIEFEKVLVAGKWKNCIINVRYGCNFAPNYEPPEVDKAAAKAQSKRDSVRHIAPPSPSPAPAAPTAVRKSTTQKMLAESNIEAAELTGRWLLIRQLKERWFCARAECGEICCYVGQDGRHMKLMEADIKDWASAIERLPHSVDIEQPSLEIFKRLRERQNKADKLTDERKSKVKVEQISPYQQPPYLPFFQPQFYPPPPQYIAPTPPHSSKRRRSRSPGELPKRRRERDDGEERVAAALVKQSSPMGDDVDMAQLLVSFGQHCDQSIPANRRQRIPGIISTIEQQGWSLEELRELKTVELLAYGIPAAPFKLLLKEITPFKRWHKKMSADLHMGAHLTSSLSIVTPQQVENRSNIMLGGVQSAQ